jgi:hypothetical protein
MPSMDSKKYIGMDVHKESISIAVRNDIGKIVMECVIETKANMILQFFDGLRGDLQVTYRSRSIKWAEKQEKVQPKEMCVFLTSTFRWDEKAGLQRDAISSR